MLVICIYILYN